MVTLLRAIAPQELLLLAIHKVKTSWRRQGSFWFAGNALAVIFYCIIFLFAGPKNHLESRNPLEESKTT
ncbi:MAG TPA: hypothetical protein VGK22_07980 [Candidatus Angelobacter sp.]|jgi:hypothetical protein